MVDDGGHLRRALIKTGITTDEGPVEGCGWAMSGTTGPSTAVIPLGGSTYDYQWWLRIAYVASGASGVTVEAGDSTVQGSLNKGLGSLYVKVRGSFDEVRISGLEDDAGVCVDTIEVGTPVPGGPL